MAFTEGQRVVLAALPEGWAGDPSNPSLPEERGEILDGPNNGVYYVRVDGPLEPGDDGLREVPEDQVSAET